MCMCVMRFLRLPKSAYITITEYKKKKHRLDYFFKAGLSEGLGGGGGFALGLDRVPDPRLKVAELSSSSSWMGVGGRGLSLWALLNVRSHKIRKFLSRTVFFRPLLSHLHVHHTTSVSPSLWVFVVPKVVVLWVDRTCWASNSWNWS